MTFVCRREVFPNGILYASHEWHYSVFKTARMYRMECVKINTLWSGEIDCDGFEAKLLCHKDKPGIVDVNIGNFLLLCFSLWLFPVPSLFSFWFWLSQVLHPLWWGFVWSHASFCQTCKSWNVTFLLFNFLLLSSCFLTHNILRILNVV